MHRLVLCVVIVGAALAAFAPRDVEGHRAVSSPAAVTLHGRLPAVCRCEPSLPVTPAAAALAGVVQSPRAKAPMRLPRPLALAVIVLFASLVSRRVAGRSPLGSRRTGATEAWRQRRVSRGPPAAVLSRA
jgi:hypothetical protein